MFSALITPGMLVGLPRAAVYTREPTQEDMRDGSAESGQFVFRLTMADWEVGTTSLID